MHTNDNEKQEPMEENRAGVDNFKLDRRLVEEINILKLEGSLFCFDPKEAKRRRGKLTLADVRKEPVTVHIHPDFGQPSVLAYKVLQSIFLKVAETACSLAEDGRCLYDGTVSFSARELASLTSRSWGGRTSKQLFEAIMQLRSTQVYASLYHKHTNEWQLVNFQMLNSAFFSGRGETISRCMVTLAPEVIDSINRRHVATFNFHRLSTLDTIGLVLYKRIFFHFSNLMPEKKGRGALRFTKDYEAICKEWLGGLKPLHYKAHILKDQLGRHFDVLKATGLIGRAPALEKNKAGTGFNVTFHPGPGFFEDYQAYYLDKKPARLSMRTVAELQEVKALELVAYFHRKLGRLERTRFEDHETAYATELLAKHTEAEVRDLIDYAVAEAPRTNWEPLYFGSLKRFVDEWGANAARRKKRERREAAVNACPLCNKDGMLELRKQATGHLFVHECPHRLELITKIEEGLNAYRV